MGHRRGFSLIEVLVTIGVIGVLIGLLLPAVQAAREAARHSRCGNNARQIGLALHSYESTFGVFPMACGVPNYARGEFTNSIVAMKQYSAFTQLLPHLDQRVLFDATNFEVDLVDPCIFPGAGVGRSVNATVMATTLQVLLCPSDGRPGGGTNYRFNLGAGWSDTLVPAATDGPLMSYRSSPAAATTDGLSNTVAFAEKLRGRLDDVRIDPRTDMFQSVPGVSHTAEEGYRACAGGLGSGSYSCGGLWWFVGTLSQTCYNHVIEPNSVVPDCYSAVTNPIRGLFGARSNHSGGVFAGMADGSVRFVKNSIRRETWMALGTRAGGEAVGSDW